MKVFIYNFPQLTSANFGNTTRQRTLCAVCASVTQTLAVYDLNSLECLNFPLPFYVL